MYYYVLMQYTYSAYESLYDIFSHLIYNQRHDGNVFNIVVVSSKGLQSLRF
jgi:hypothetical protein